MQKNIEVKNTLLEIVIAVLPSLTDAVIKTLEKTIENSRRTPQSSRSDGLSHPPFYTGDAKEVAATSDSDKRTTDKSNRNEATSSSNEP
ncbi:hypothetical protein [Brevibacillus laterosporus]|uniref:hypothetical protein n=1 Tax=Brevibacillus laterosporus TaxID=1465 RepID=UPI0026517B7D|nr:hypothetical protein [Brevibacillus laterosporus]MDN9011916.1 hypothetical protein [Brevibacillus laterosporus]MDO0943012.1 hypothetical protein [Brevibacillus laterosporus]